MLPLQQKDATKQKNPFGKKGVGSTPAKLQAGKMQNPDLQEADLIESDAPTLVETNQSQPEDSGWEETQMVEDVDGTQVSSGHSIFDRSRLADKVDIHPGSDTDQAGAWDTITSVVDLNA
jgi:chromosome transmission fidelity protein 4